jgi:glucose-1-phosphate adenylyltransferase
MMHIQNILSQTATFVLAGGRGARLGPLTYKRSKPAVPFGDRRIIDFVLANCLRSKLKHPAVITQYQAAHLTQHVRRWWLERSASGAAATASPVCVPCPSQEYLGTADALFRNVQLLETKTQYVLVLSADHIYDMDYRALLQFHADRDADATLAAVVYPSESSHQFGILEVDESGRIAGFEEKPTHPKELPGRPGRVLASMGIYVFNKRVFLDALQRDAEDSQSVHDIGRNILPDLLNRSNLSAFRFEDPETGAPRYWKDVGTIDSYYEASMTWLSTLPENHSLSGSGSVISEGVRIHRTAEVVDSILMPGVVIGPGARVRRTILDENVRVLAGARLGYETSESHVFARTANGVVVVQADSIIPATSGSYARPRQRQIRLESQLARS